MCVTTGDAHLKKTVEYAGIMENGNHYLIYGNIAESKIKDKNAMPIPIPTSDIESILLHDTRKYGKELNQIADSFIPRSRGITRSGNTRGMYKTIKNGNYTSFVGHISHIGEICRNENVKISDELMDFYVRNYEGWSIVVCTWNGDIDAKNEPIHIEYNPNLFPNDLFMYMMDGHDGQKPKNEIRDLDHILLYSIPNAKSGQRNKMNYSETLLNKIPNLNQDLYYIILDNQDDNGDLWLNLKGTQKEFSLIELIEWGTPDGINYSKFKLNPKESY